MTKSLVRSNRSYFQGIGYSNESHTVQGILRLKHCRHFSSFQRIQRPLRSPGTSDRFYIFGGTINRQIGTSRILSGVGHFLKIRYLVLTSAVGGGITLNKVKSNLYWWFVMKFCPSLSKYYCNKSFVFCFRLMNLGRNICRTLVG